MTTNLTMCIKSQQYANGTKFYAIAVTDGQTTDFFGDHCERFTEAKLRAESLFAAFKGQVEEQGNSLVLDLTEPTA